MDDCDNCVTHLKKNHTQSQALMASQKRRAGKGADSIAADMQVTELHMRKAEKGEKNSFALNEAEFESKMSGLNDELIDMHISMQLLSSL